MRPSIVDKICRDLLLEREDLERLIENVGSEYKSFMVGERRIDAPKLDLKYVQSWILDYVRAETPELPAFVAAYEPGCSIVANAKAHCGNAHVLCMDIRGFFRSCSSDIVRSFFTAMNVGLSEQDTNILTMLSTHNGSLPMGSPCSPAIANRIMLPIDYELISALGGSRVYTRYSDDITLSSASRLDVAAIVDTASEILGAYGFEINPKKIRCVGRGDARKVTGVYITPDGFLSIGSRRKREINTMVYRFLMYGEGSAAKILGMLDFARSVEPRYVTNLIIKYAMYGRAAECGGVISALKYGTSCDTL